jgi:UPF0755 protein
MATPRICDLLSNLTWKEILSAIEAALNPEKTDFLFFVADGSGGHVFAKTLSEHNKNVAKWRKIEKNKN